MLCDDSEGSDGVRCGRVLEEGEDIYICIAESLCSTAETHTTL